VLSGRGLCDELITRPEESYRLWCVVVCDLENLVNEEAMTRVASRRQKRKKKSSRRPIPVASQSKAWVCGRSLAGIAGLSSVRGISVCLLSMLYVVR